MRWCWVDWVFAASPGESEIRVCNSCITAFSPLCLDP